MICRGIVLLTLLTMLAAGLPGCGASPAATAAVGNPWTDDDRDRVRSLEEAVTDMRAMLVDYYQGTAVLDDSWVLHPDDPLRERGVEFLAGKMARAIAWQEDLVIGTIGSSVTAGYDNCRYDCYQQQLERLMDPVLERGGSGLEVRNAGQGGVCGDSFDNQVWCLPMLAGQDIDIAHYSWTYFEAEQPDRVLPAHEMFYRWSLLMPHSPVPQLVYANGCAHLNPRDRVLLDAYAEFGTDILCMTRGLVELGYEPGEWGEMGDPLHETSREGEAPGTSELRRKSLSVMYRNWHPGPLLFQTAADAMAWRYSEALLLALEWIAAEPDPRSRWPRKPAPLALAELPEPTECPQEWCEFGKPPVCTNFEQPVFGTAAVELLAAEDNGWVFEPGVQIRPSGIPREEQDLPQCIHPNRCSGWRVPPGQQAGPLSFRLPGLELGLVAVCCGAKHCGETMLAAGAEFLLDGRPPQPAPEALWDSKCVQVQARFPETEARRQSGSGQTVQLDVILPVLDQPLPPITHVFGL